MRSASAGPESFSAQSSSLSATSLVLPASASASLLVWALAPVWYAADPDRSSSYTSSESLSTWWRKAQCVTHVATSTMSSSVLDNYQCNPVGDLELVGPEDCMGPSMLVGGGLRRRRLRLLGGGKAGANLPDRELGRTARKGRRAHRAGPPPTRTALPTQPSPAPGTACYAPVTAARARRSKKTKSWSLHVERAG